MLEHILEKISRDDIIKKIEHTLLKPDSTWEEVKKVCIDTIRYGFYGCCISPFYVEKAKSVLEGSDVKLVTVIGFPLGFSPTAAKKTEAEHVLVHGVDEIDMVMNISAFKSGLMEVVSNDISEIKDIVRQYGGVLKVIIETGFLSDHEIMKASQIAVAAGADFVKTSTGLGPRGASLKDVLLIKKAIGGKAGIKAAGGIRTAIEAAMFILAGADRIGTSSGVKIALEALKYFNIRQ